MPALTFSSTSPAWHDCMPTTLQKILQETVSPSGAVLGSGGIYFGTDADPNGNVTATRPATYYNDVGNVWVKTNAGNNSSGWSQIM